MWSYTLLLHTAAPLDVIEAWLAARLGEPEERGEMKRGALSAFVDDPGPLGTEEYDAILDGPVTGEVGWSVEHRGDEAAYEEAERLLRLTVTRLVVEFDASALFLWEHDVVMMSRIGGEMILYDDFTEWFWPEVKPFLPPHAVSSKRWIV